MEKLSLVDYDGKVAATLFTAGCNYRCPFCHNSPLVVGVTELTPLSETEVFDYLTRRKNVLDGVCVSGGEPTLQPDLPDFLAKLKALGFSVKLDTNGTNPDMLKVLVGSGLCDYVAMDIKNSKERYAETVGLPSYRLDDVEESVEFLLSDAVDYEFRTTLINGYHTKQDITNIAKWIAGAKAYALQKFKDSGSCIASGLSEIDEQTANEYLALVKPFIPSTKLRGY